LQPNSIRFTCFGRVVKHHLKVNTKIIRTELMNKQLLIDGFGALVVAVMLILTAWGNAVAMLIFAVLGLIVGFLLSRKSTGC
jgi:hypothetical protein